MSQVLMTRWTGSVSQVLMTRLRGVSESGIDD